jgi:hypothetical protein
MNQGVSDAELDAMLTDWGKAACSVAEHQPVPNLTFDTRRLRRPRRLRPSWPFGWQVAAGALAVALAAAIAVGLPRWVGEDRGPAGSLGGVTSTASAGPGFQAVTFHGLSITVPASWSVNGFSCTLTSSVVELPGSSPACGRRPYPEFTIVQFVEGTDLLPKDSVSRTIRTNISGLPATRVEADRAAPDITDRPAFGYVVAKLHVSVLIQPAQGETGQELAGSLRVDAVDMHGCRSRRSDMNQPPRSATSDRAGMAQALIPDQPVSAILCRYSHGWLEEGSVLSGAALRAFAAGLNRLPVGLSAEPDPADCGGAGGFGPVDDPANSSAYRIEARYPDGSPVILIARFGSCGDLEIFNGARSGQLTDDLRILLGRLVG